MKESPNKDKTLTDRAWQYCQEKTEPFIEAVEVARRANTRASEHIAKVEGVVDDLPDQIQAAEDNLNKYIADGRQTDHPEKKLMLLKNTLKAKEEWLDGSSSKFQTKVSQELRRAEERLRQATQAAVKYCLGEFTDEVNKSMSEVWDVYEEFENLKRILTANNRPTLLGKWPIDISGFIATLKTADELLRFKREFIDAMPAALQRSKYAVKDEQMAISQKPVKKPVKSKPKHALDIPKQLTEVDIVKVVEDETGVKLPARRLVDVRVTQANFEDMTRELTQEAIQLKVKGIESIQELRPVPKDTAEAVREKRVDDKEAKAQENPVLTMTTDDLDKSDVEIPLGVPI